MSCNKYQELIQEIYLNPEQAIPRHWKSHANSCPQCQKNLKEIQDQKKVNQILKSQFQGLKKEFSKKSISPLPLGVLQERLEKELNPGQKTFKSFLDSFNFSQGYKFALTVTSLVIFIGGGIMLFRIFYSNEGQMESTPKNPVVAQLDKNRINGSRRKVLEKEMKPAIHRKLKILPRKKNKRRDKNPSRNRKKGSNNRPGKNGREKRGFSE